MKKRPPGWKKRQEQKRAASSAALAPGVSLRTGQDAEDAFLALVDRMEQQPENFLLIDSDLKGY